MITAAYSCRRGPPVPELDRSKFLANKMHRAGGGRLFQGPGSAVAKMRARCRERVRSLPMTRAEQGQWAKPTCRASVVTSWLRGIDTAKVRRPAAISGHGCSALERGCGRGCGRRVANGMRTQATRWLTAWPAREASRSRAWQKCTTTRAAAGAHPARGPVMAGSRAIPGFMRRLPTPHQPIRYETGGSVQRQRVVRCLNRPAQIFRSSMAHVI